jgi:hypothetical protein
MDDDFDFLKPSKVFFLDTNLSSPVLTTELDATRQLIDRFILFAEARDAQWKASSYERTEFSFLRKLVKLNGWKKAEMRKWEQLIPEQYKTIEEEFLKGPNTFVTFYDEAKEIAKIIEEAVADGLEARGLPRESIEGTANALGSSPCLKFRCAYEQFCNLFGRAESRVCSSEHTWSKGAVGAVEIWIHPKYAFLKVKGVMYRSSLNQILMLKDKLATRYMLLEHVAPLRLKSSLVKHLFDLFAWQDFTLEQYGNRAYGILKAVEPMFKTRLSHVTDNIFGEDTAYTRMIEKMKKKEMAVIRELGFDARAMDKLITLVEQVETTDEIVEMFGCLKSCGHPIIDPIRGGLSAAAEARSPDQTSFADAQRLRNTFCHIILTSYISKHAQWPKLIYTKKGLKMEILNARQERNITYASYPLEEWTFVEWTKLFDMDYFPNFLELMDDKSISYYRSEKHLAWEFGSKPSSQRRLLLEVLQRANINLEELVKRVSNRDIPWDWFIVTLYPKEREFKEDPRMFAMLVLEMRCFFTCIEANIADKVFRYMPQQTMTKTKTQIQERFLSFTDPSRNPTDWTLFLEIDLSRWNLRWRQMVIHMLGHDLNKMFGVRGTFTLTHWFFAMCQIVVRVGGLRPEGIELDNPPESGLAWRNHLGGFEGLNQKLWTAATYAMVEMALAPMVESRTISSYELIGQGDNQVIRVGVPIRPDTRENVLPAIRDELNDRLEKTCASVNQEVKPDENVESTAVLTYSKDVYVKGVEYPTSLKKHSRLFPVTSMDFPSTAMNASAIMAGAVAASENSRHSLCSAVIGWYHTARYLLAATSGYSIHGKQSSKFGRTEVISALILPPSIGGYIGTPIASFLYKGGSDPLGKEISSLRLLADSGNLAGVIASRALRGLEEKYYIETGPNLETLIDNPYALPIAKGASPLSKVSHLTLEAFRPKVVNVDIKPLLDTSVTKAEQVLKQDILSISPLNPLLAHDLFEASGFGTVKIMRKMFLTTRTVQSVAQWVNPNITHNFLKADRNDMLWFKTWLKGLPARGYSKRNSFELVTQFRRYWGVDLHGVTNYQPLDCYHSSNTTRDPSSVKWSSHSESDLLTTRGPLSGYIGTATREKRSEHGYKIVDAGAPSRAMMKLQLIRSQAYGNQAFNELLDRIGRTRTNVKLSEITDLLQKVLGGSISHKYATAIRSMAASYVGPLNFVTHIRLDTDSMGKVSGGLENYPLMTQEYMVLASAQAKLLNVHKGVKCGELMIETRRMNPLPDDTLTCPDPRFLAAMLPRTRLLYTPNLLISRTYDSLAQSIPRAAIASVSTYPEREVIELAAVGFFLDLLRDSSKAKLLADTRGLAAIPSKLQMDIAEAHSLGPHSLVRCMATAILTTSLRDIFRTLHLHPERWDESLFIAHIIKTCIRACSSYWRHPLFYSHKDFGAFRHTKLRYDKTMTIENRIEAKIRRQLIEMTNNVDDPYWIRPVPTFAGTQSMSPIEALTIAGVKALYPLYIMADPRAREFGNLYSSYTRLPVGTTFTSDDLLKIIRTRFTKLSSVYRKAGDMILAERISDLGHMKGVIVFNDDYRTVLRYSRGLEAGVGEIRSKRLKIKSFPDVGDIDTCPDCVPEPVSKYQSMWSRYSKRKNGGLSSAGYTWLPLMTKLRVLNNVMVVGSGNGGLADLLITMFGCHVVGTDLESDLPTETATLMNYLPIGLESYNASHYTQSDLCLTTDGDWTNPDTREQFLKTILTKTTVFFDATLHAFWPHRDMIKDIMNQVMVDRLYIRTIDTPEEQTALYKRLKTRYGIRMWTVSHTYGSRECIFEIRRIPDYHLHTCTHTVKELSSYILDDMHQAIPARTHELAIAATCSVVEWHDETLEEMHHKLASLCSSLLNKDKKRQLVYRERINLIYAYLTTTAAISPSAVQTIQEWMMEETCETDLFEYKTNERVITHLIRYASRLLQTDLASGSNTYT